MLYIAVFISIFSMIHECHRTNCGNVNKAKIFFIINKALYESIKFPIKRWKSFSFTLQITVEGIEIDLSSFGRKHDISMCRICWGRCPLPVCFAVFPDVVWGLFPLAAPLVCILRMFRQIWRYGSQRGVVLIKLM